MKRSEMGLGDYGEVSLFGLDEFGAPVGLNPAWGGLAGAGVQTATAVAVRQFTKSARWYKWSEAIGALASVVVGGAMVFFEGTRAAGWTGIAAGVVSGGIRQLENSVSERGKAVQAMLEQTGALGIATIYPAEIPGRLNGAVQVQPLGVPTIYPAEIPGQLNGSGFGAGPQLLGAQAQLLGVPISGASALSGHYGTTAIG